MDNIGELQTKYQRLAQEYQKIRGQNSVLKKAVIDEQATNKSHQETLKQRDQTIRKYEQDIDSLEFRNAQLSKRVEILQGELDDYERKGVKPQKGQKGHVDVSASQLNVVQQQELQLKISENEALHKQLQEIDQTHQSVVEELRARVETLEGERKTHQSSLEEANSRQEVVMERLKEEQTMLEAKLHKQEEELKFANIMAEKYQQQLKGVHQELKTKLDKTTKLMQEKVPFIDTESSELNSLNLPVFDKTHQRKSHHFIEVFTNHLVLLMAGVSDYHTYIEQRLQAYSTDVKQESLSAANQRFSSHLLANATYTRKVQRDATKFRELALKETFISLSSLPGFQNLVGSFKEYVKYLEKILPYRSISLDEELKSPTWSETLEKASRAVFKEEQKLFVVFQKVSSYVEVLATVSVPPSAVPILLKKTMDNFKSLSEICKAACVAYKSKSTEEHEIPTYTERLKSTDECIISSLRALEAASMKMYKAFEENLPFLTSLQGLQRKGITADPNQEVTPVLKDLHKQAVGYMETIKASYSPSVPYDVAVRNQRNLAADDTDALSQQIAKSQESIVKLETEKEHWMLEAQLMKAKYEKETKKVGSISEELKKLKLDVQSKSTDENLSFEGFVQQERNRQNARTQSQLSSVSNMSDSPQSHVQLGAMEVFKEKSGSIDCDHEALVKEHLSSRIAHLTKQLQHADSKCVNFYSEAHSLYKQLVVADRYKHRLGKELEDSNKKVENLQDELETTKRSYEDQLKMLSDHLCGMNEKLTEQKDEIDVLKTSGAQPSKGSKFHIPGRKK